MKWRQSPDMTIETRLGHVIFPSLCYLVAYVGETSEMTGKNKV